MFFLPVTAGNVAKYLIDYADKLAISTGLPPLS
ncbi:hypothetical protein ACNJC6_02028 [Acinetobacter johnsonii]|uniref:Uncharacterized protein n=1 Tax=Acinetobacter johnsonii TaxID=40214 RepID=A0A1R7QDZ7_ACIJO|nr:hypothetical protein ACNJC6_02028 [Acinetobacter johnsonii]